MGKHPKFVIASASGGKFRFTLSAKNGQVILTSQSYASKASCKNGIESVCKNAGNDGSFERKEAKDGRSFFNLLAANKQVIGSSQMYKSTSARDAGIASVQANAGSAEVEDTTTG